MAFENFPSAASHQRPVAPPRLSWMAFVAGILFFALSAAIGYIIWYKNQAVDVIRDKIVSEKPLPVIVTNNNDTAKTAQLTALQNELADINNKYALLKTLDARKDSTYSHFDKEIAAKRDSIIMLLSKMRVTNADYAKAQNLIATLKTNIDGYKEQVVKLSGEKADVIKEKMDAIEQRDKVKSNFDSAVNVIKEKEDSLDIGSTLSAVNFSITSIDQKPNGKERETSVARKVDKLRISFEIAQNRIAPSGLKELYICVSDPGNMPIAVEALGSGKFPLREGGEKFYTEKIDINYIQGPPNQVISFDWRQNTNFEPGNYKIEVYNNGFKIGEGIRALK